MMHIDHIWQPGPDIYRSMHDRVRMITELYEGLSDPLSDFDESRITLKLDDIASIKVRSRYGRIEVGYKHTGSDWFGDAESVHQRYADKEVLRDVLCSALENLQGHWQDSWGEKQIAVLWFAKRDQIVPECCCPNIVKYDLSGIMRLKRMVIAIPGDDDIGELLDMSPVHVVPTRFPFPHGTMRGQLKRYCDDEMRQMDTDFLVEYHRHIEPHQEYVRKFFNSRIRKGEEPSFSLADYCDYLYEQREIEVSKVVKEETKQKKREKFNALRSDTSSVAFGSELEKLLRLCLRLMKLSCCIYDHLCWTAELPIYAVVGEHFSEHEGFVLTDVTGARAYKIVPSDFSSANFARWDRT
jgi:hypothetical protein